MKVALLTGGKDPHYARGLVRELAARGVDLAVVGSDELAGCETAGPGRVEFHNLVDSQDPGDGPAAKAWRVLSYYARLLVFAARTDARLFHVLWFRKFPLVERTLLKRLPKAPAEAAGLHGPQRRRPGAGREEGDARREALAEVPLPDRGLRPRPHREDETGSRSDVLQFLSHYRYELRELKGKHSVDLLAKAIHP